MVLVPVQGPALEVRRLVRGDDPDVPHQPGAAAPVPRLSLLKVDAPLTKSLLSVAVSPTIPRVIVETVECVISRVSMVSMMTMVLSMMLMMMVVIPRLCFCLFSLSPSSRSLRPPCCSC